ncbi:Uma2 family endonuclease [Myxacorys almedinensis]|uniref:Uma2 family endonuclease n=1 Tax=Myxacorys almedinensis A TaxID=2690445 RepID=A0A8J7YYR9_9CYAN|nr:Uma2 family endonuclease [Myxacorys almedinensis]NDJ15850.1 Uma2 family endonuclease [Myxacorys almedinensis A]
MSFTKLSDRTATLLEKPCRWQSGTWNDYLALRDHPHLERLRIFFDQEWLWFEMGSEGINHSKFSNLLTMMTVLWKQRHPEQTISSLGGCQLEKVGKKACAPDLVIYLGDDVPQWGQGQRRFINLDESRVPDLVGEISDTTLATDLDEKKRLYASLGIPEYWVIDVRGSQILAFQLQETGNYELCDRSQAFSGLTIALLEQTVERLATEANTDAALWFAEQIASQSMSQS